MVDEIDKAAVNAVAPPSTTAFLNLAYMYVSYDKPYSSTPLQRILASSR